MSALVRLIGLDGRDIGRRAVPIMAGGAVVAVATAVATWFLGVGLYAVLLDRLSPAQAALAVALVGFAVAAIAAAITIAALRRARRAVSSAIRASTLATFAPPVVRVAAHHVRLAGLVAVVGLTFLATRRK